MSHLPELVSPDLIPVIRLPKERITDPTEAHHGSLFLLNLPSADLRRIAPDLTIKVFNQEEHVQHDGEIIHNILFPHNMTVSLIGLTADGHAIESTCVGREGFLGVESMLGSAAATCGAVARRGQASSIALDRLLILTDQLPFAPPCCVTPDAIWPDLQGWRHATPFIAFGRGPADDYCWNWSKPNRGTLQSHRKSWRARWA